MALNIKDSETDRLARELARATGESITVAARIAIEERLARVRSRRTIPPAQDLHAIIHRGRSRAILVNKTPDEILGYDEHGVPS